MYEFTVVQPFDFNGYVYQIGEKISDPEVIPLLETPKYARNVSRHYVTETEVPELPVVPAKMDVKALSVSDSKEQSASE